jgi:hypothetical protein
MTDAPEQSAWKRLWYSRLFVSALTLFLAYSFLVWLLPRLINQDAIRRILVSHAAYFLGTDVEIGEVEPELRYFGGWRLRLRDVRVSNPSPDFGIEDGQELLSVRKIVFEGSMRDLLAGYWRPRILVKGWTLTIFRNRRDSRLNLSMLLHPQGVRPASNASWPFNRIVNAQQTFELEEGRIVFAEGVMGEANWKTSTGLLAGEGYFLPAASKGRAGAKVELAFSGPVSVDDADVRVQTACSLQKIRLDEDGLKGTWQVNMNVDEAPAKRVSRILEINFPQTAARLCNWTLMFHGAFGESRTGRNDTCDLQLRNSPLPLLGLEAPLSVRMEWDPNRPAAPLPSRMRIREIGGKGREARLHATPAPLSDKRNIRIEAPLCNFSEIFAAREQDSWLRNLLPLIHTATLSADRLQMLGFGIDQALAKATVEGNEIAKIEVLGSMADGSFVLVASDWATDAAALPNRMGIDAINIDARAAAARLGHLLPRIARCVPAEGAVSGRIIYPVAAQVPVCVRMPLPAERQQGKRGMIPPTPDKGLWLFELRISHPLTFSEPGDNILLQALWELPANLSAFRKGSDKTPPSLSALRITEGMLSAQSHPSLGAVVHGSLRTEELGVIRLRTEIIPRAEKTPRGLLLAHITPYTHAENSIEEGSVLPQLDKETMSAVLALEHKEGLCISIDYAAETAEAEPTYCRDIAAALKAEKTADDSPAERPDGGDTAP